MEEKLKRLFAMSKEGSRICVFVYSAKTKLWIIDLAELPFLSDKSIMACFDAIQQLRHKQIVLADGPSGTALMSPEEAIQWRLQSLTTSTGALLQEHWTPCCVEPTCRFNELVYHVYVWRRATADDHARVKELAREAGFFTKQINLALQELSKKGQNLETRRRISPERPSDFMVVEEEEEHNKTTVGFCLFTEASEIPPRVFKQLGEAPPEFRETRYIYISYLFISTSMRGRGLSRCILGLLSDTAAAYRNGVYLEVEVSQILFAGARRFWEAMGFRQGQGQGKQKDLWYLSKYIADPTAWLGRILGWEDAPNETPTGEDEDKEEEEEEDEDKEEEDEDEEDEDEEDEDEEEEEEGDVSRVLSKPMARLFL